MELFREGITSAFELLVSFNRELFEIIWLSFRVSGLATAVATLLGVPLGLCVAFFEFPLKRTVVTLLNTLMALPTVVVGLMLYGMLANRGPLGAWNILFTPSAIVIGEVVLALPIIAALTISAVSGVDPRLRDTLVTLGASTVGVARVTLLEVRFGLLAAVIAGFGRVVAEVGAAMQLGGNIEGFTRTIPTAIALESSKGEFGFGIALGIVLLLVALLVNVALQLAQGVK